MLGASMRSLVPRGMFLVATTPSPFPGMGLTSHKAGWCQGKLVYTETSCCYDGVAE
jgi:hypothetical protein